MPEFYRTTYKGQDIEVIVHKCMDGEIFVSQARPLIDGRSGYVERDYASLMKAVAKHEKRIGCVIGAQLATMIKGTN